MKPFSRIFVEVPVTYGEMIEVLTKLGYIFEFDGKNSRYVNDKYDSYVLLRDTSPDEILEKAYAAAYSSLLYRQGVIKEEESLIYMIQKNRLKKSKKATNNRQLSA
jgi:hypothetical protein